MARVFWGWAVYRVVKLVAAAFILFACVFGGPLRAATLTGDVITAQYFYPTPSTLYFNASDFLHSADPSNPSPLDPVGANVEGTLLVEGVTKLIFDFSASSLVITFDTQLSNPIWNTFDLPTKSNVTQNGPKFTIQTPIGGSFVGVDSVTASNKFLVTAVIDNTGALFVNWAGMPYQTGDTVTVLFSNSDDAPPTTTPLPAALPLFASGLAALGLIGWRQRRQRVS